ncbi:hypothetical protein FRC03_004920 [Tulasnella sp. 419]|nr:hypothetical protein FRC03_004920 [Tulasnella sp. 419]
MSSVDLEARRQGMLVKHGRGDLPSSLTIAYQIFAGNCEHCCRRSILNALGLNEQIERVLLFVSVSSRSVPPYSEIDSCNQLRTPYPWD